MFQRYRKHHQIFNEPVLIVCLRDFDLDIPEHPDAELKQLLGKENSECFRSMKVFFFAKPTTRPNLRHMHKMSEADLDQMYIQSRNDLERFIKKEERPLCTCRGGRITSNGNDFGIFSLYNYN